MNKPGEVISKYTSLETEEEMRNLVNSLVGQDLGISLGDVMCSIIINQAVIKEKLNRMSNRLDKLSLLVISLKKPNDKLEQEISKAVKDLN